MSLSETSAFANSLGIIDATIWYIVKRTEFIVAFVENFAKVLDHLPERKRSVIHMSIHIVKIFSITLILSLLLPRCQM